MGGGFHGDIAIDDIKVVPGVCPLPASCDFELNLCGWSQMRTDVFDWVTKSGDTPSIATGPHYDHTLKTASGMYGNRYEAES